MENVSVSVEGRKLHIEVDLDVAGRSSKSGKSTLLATTGGEIVTLGGLLDDLISDDENVVVGVNVYRPIAA